LFEPWKWAAPIANAWRTTLDIRDTWSSFLSILDLQEGLELNSGKGGWNDPDSLEVGNKGMRYEEYQSQFAFWCLLKAPLFLGNNIKNMSKEIYELITNEELIAINQDKLGKQGKKITKSAIPGS